MKKILFLALFIFCVTAGKAGGPVIPGSFFLGINGFEKLISFLPVILFLAIVFIIMIKLRNANIKLCYFLEDKEQQVAIKKEETKTNEAITKAIAANPAAAAALDKSSVRDGSDTPAAAEPPQSTSRLLAFISGITTIALAVCITTFYFYRYLSGKENPDLGHLSTVLYGLGLGIVPYGFTKVAGALKQS